MSKLGTNPTPKMNFYPEYVPATRPAAPVEGLETVGYVTTSPTGAEVFQRKPLVPGHGQFGYKQDAVVTRSQAEELLAAERAETMRQVKHWSELYKQQHYRAEKAEAIIAAVTAQRDALIEAGLKCCNGTPNPELPRFDLALSFINSTNEARKAADIVCQDLKANNAALTARVKELEAINHNRECANKYLGEVAEENGNRAQALETQLAAAKKALEPFAEASKYYSNGINRRVADDAEPCGPALLVGHLHKARAALGASHGE